MSGNIFFSLNSEGENVETCEAALDLLKDITLPEQSTPMNVLDTYIEFLKVGNTIGDLVKILCDNLSKFRFFLFEII